MAKKRSARKPKAVVQRALAVGTSTETVSVSVDGKVTKFDAIVPSGFGLQPPKLSAGDKGVRISLVLDEAGPRDWNVKVEAPRAGVVAGCRRTNIEVRWRKNRLKVPVLYPNGRTFADATQGGGKNALSVNVPFVAVAANV